MPNIIWGILAAPLIAAQDPPPLVGTDDAFGGLVILETDEMRDAAGGADTAIDVGAIGVNISGQAGEVAGVATTNSPTGQIAGNLVSDNGGVTTVFNNTGNGVIFQNTLNVNIFLNPQQ
jgi:hypothetical protein